MPVDKVQQRVAPGSLAFRSYYLRHGWFVGFSRPGHHSRRSYIIHFRPAQENCNELHTAESRQFGGAYAFEREERRIEIKDQIACAAWLREHGRRGPLEREVLEHGPE